MVQGLEKKIFYHGEKHNFKFKIDGVEFETQITAPSQGFYNLVANPISRIISWTPRDIYYTSNSWGFEFEKVIVLPNQEMAKWSEFLLRGVLLTEGDLALSDGKNMLNLDKLENLLQKVIKIYYAT